MSGEPGAIIQSTYYFIRYTSGIRVTPAIPPFWDWEKDGDYTAHFFNEENRYFSDKLKDIKPELDRLFGNLVQNSNLPILKYDPDGALHQTIDFYANDLQPVELRLTVSEELTHENIEEIKQLIKPIFEDEGQA